MFTKMLPDQIQSKLHFISSYMKSKNAADGSHVDANANVESKNVATLAVEMNKDIFIQIKRAMMIQKINKHFDSDITSEYLSDLSSHEVYVHDETSAPGVPYCVSISLYPFLLNGTKDLNGISNAPKHLDSFCGSFINLVFAVSSQFAGACLYKDQEIIIKENGKFQSIKIKDFVEKFNLTSSFVNHQGHWEYGNVNNIEVYEDGKFVKLNKVYRRDYSEDIYEIRTKNNRIVRCSKDHIFKVKYRGRIIECKAKDLQLHDTVFPTDSLENQIDKESKDYKIGQIVGLIAGDGNIQETQTRISINYRQRFIADFLDKTLPEFFDCSPTLNDGHGCFNYYIGSTNISKLVKEYFNNSNCVDFKYYDKCIDTSKYSLEFLIGFLDGLLTADGGYNNSIFLALSNKFLIQNVVDILSKIGVNIAIGDVVLEENKKQAYKITIPIRFKKYLKLFNIRHEDNVKYNNSQSEEFYYEGEFCNYKASNNYIDGCKNVTKNRHIVDKEHMTDVIVDIKKFKNDHQYVYEIETETHWYSCGGLLTHNCATSEFFLAFDTFARKDYGDNYLETHGNVIKNRLQEVIYCINQPATARGFQSCFWNVSIFDKAFYEGMFNNFIFPDGSKPNYESLNRLQRFFLEWFREERTKALLTFPVVTVCMKTNESGNSPEDKAFAHNIAEEMEKGNSFFIYQSPNVSSIASCCRLRSEMEKNEFSSTLGVLGVMTGSVHVITMNMNRIIQRCHKTFLKEKFEIPFIDYLKSQIYKMVQNIHKYHIAFRAILQDFMDAHMMPVYHAGFIDLKKQFSTIGINGMVEGCEFLGMVAGNNDEYMNFVSEILKVISEENKKASKHYGVKFNTEFVPAENLGYKNALNDSKDGYFVPRSIYNSYFYPVEHEEVNMLDKFILHGEKLTQYLDGGSALHLNLAEHLTKKQYLALFDIACKTGCSYWCVNVKMTICNECRHIDYKTLHKCPKCNSMNIDWATRIIGYLKRISSFSSPRQKEAATRFYHERE